MTVPNYIGRWNERYRSAPSLLSKALTILELLMPPLMLAALLYATSYLVAASIGFAPYTINGFETIPNIGCVGDPLSVKLDRTRDDVPLGDVTDVDTWSYWISDKGEVTPKEPFSAAIGPLGRHVIESDLVRSMPIVPGEWAMVWEVTVSGHVLGVDADQTIVHRGKQKLSVLERTPANAHLCKGY